MDEVKTLSDYLSIVRRRKFIIALPFLLLLLVSVIVVLSLPSVYQSEATILIEQQHIPVDLVKSTVTSYADERIQLIQQRIMTVANLAKIIDKYGLYKQERRKLSMSEVVDIFRENSLIEMVNADVVSNGRNTKAAIAFKLKWTDKNPELAQKVTNELVTLYLDENKRARTERAEETTIFLGEEVEKLKLEIQKIENEIAEYKQKYSNSLPELLTVNMSTISRLESELQQLFLQEKMLNERRISLNSQLMITDPKLLTIASTNGTKSQLPRTAEDLKSLEADLLSKYSDSHPDVQRVRRQKELLKNQEQEGNGSEDPELTKARQALNELKEKYSDNHPDVKIMQKRLVDLEKQSKSENSSSTNQSNTNNPAFLQIKSEIEMAQIELQNIKTQREAIQQKIQSLETNVSQTHQVERGYYELMRDLDSNKTKYQELKGKQLQAKLSQSLEEEQKGESFTLIEPAQIPLKPIKPNRMKLLLLGFVGSLGGGFGVGFLAEMIEGSVRGHRNLVSVTGIEPLIVIPYIKNQEDINRTKKHLINFVILLVALFIAFLCAIHFLYMPLDILVYKIWQRVGLI